ncbi:MAG: DNA mismatch repair endonuclease MutL [Dehalococcoidia bacterium]
MSRSSIQVLAPDVISKIAAGEVIERPASVVKELVENSLDAGATQVSIEARGGGVGLIRVSDNGEGIPADQVELAFHRNATSKLASASDLETIASLGFRGEALPSIASVAEVEMFSLSAGETAGTLVTIREGRVVQRASRGRPQGTAVTVRNLFRAVPARLKFLKSSATENGHIANLVDQYALAHPEVRFLLYMEGRASLRSPGTGQPRDGVAAVYGIEVAQAMLELDNGDGEAPRPRITGLVAPPRLARASRGYLSFFVNGRWVQSRMMARAVEDAYHGLLMVGKHPVVVIHVSVPPQDVDVNIHPSKAEVKFRQDQAVFSALQREVRRVLVEETPVPHMEPSIPRLEPDPARTAPMMDLAPLFAASPSPGPAPQAAPELPVLRVLGQMASTYIIAEGPQGLYLVDQHAAHERILFERVVAQRESRQVDVQGLLEPLTIEVSPRQQESLQERGEDLSAFGFQIEPFGERTYLVRAVPALLAGQDLAQAVLEVVDTLGEGAESDWQERVAISLCCHGAVRAGQVLSPEEMRQLVRDLETTNMPRTCPHGRPTTVHFSAGQLEKEFGRH